MALVDLPGQITLPAMLTGGAVPGNATLYTMSVVNEAKGFVCQVPKSGEIKYLHWRTGTVTTGAVLQWRIETVDTVTGKPTGTLKDAGCSNVSQNLLDSDDSTWFRLNLMDGNQDGSEDQSSCTVAAGDVIAVTCKTSGGNWVFANVGAVFTRETNLRFPYTVLDDDGLETWSFTTSSFPEPPMALEYDDGAVLPIIGWYPLANYATTAYGNGTSPNVRALTLNFPYGVRVSGLWAWCDIDNPAELKIVNAAGVTQGSAVTLQPAMRTAATGGMIKVQLVAPITLAANTPYYLCLVPTTSSTISLYQFGVYMFASGDRYRMWDALPGNRAMHLATAVAGTWSWTSTGDGYEDQRPTMGVILDQVDVSSSSTYGVGAGFLYNVPTGRTGRGY